MFGHDDTTKPNDDSVQPEHDGVLDDSGATHDTPAEANASPAFIADAPAAAANPATDTSLSLPAAPAADDDLLNIKQSALKQLTPLVGHLNQTPEEKFRTTMMMIQASDDQSLIKDAYEAAQAIGDEKTKAQALLDIINEINYFTQHS